MAKDANLVLQLFRLWNSDMRTEEIAMEMGIKRSKLQHMAERYGLGRRTHVRKDVPSGHRVPDPTEEEIWGTLTAEIRAKWSESEERSRRVGAGSPRWKPPTIAIREIFPNTDQRDTSRA